MIRDRMVGLFFAVTDLRKECVVSGISICDCSRNRAQDVIIMGNDEGFGISLNSTHYLPNWDRTIFAESHKLFKGEEINEWLLFMETHPINSSVYSLH